MGATETWNALFGERERCQEVYGATDMQCAHWSGHAGCCVHRIDDDHAIRWTVPGRIETWMNNPIFKENRHAG
jgi:hypothetical protein